MRDIVSAPVICCRQHSDINSLHKLLFVSSTIFWFFANANANETFAQPITYTHSSFYAQLNLAKKFTSEVMHMASHRRCAKHFRIIFTFISLSQHRTQQNSNKINEFYGKTFVCQLSNYYYYYSMSATIEHSCTGSLGWHESKISFYAQHRNIPRFEFHSRLKVLLIAQLTFHIFDF